MYFLFYRLLFSICRSTIILVFVYSSAPSAGHPCSPLFSYCPPLLFFLFFCHLLVNKSLFSGGYLLVDKIISWSPMIDMPWVLCELHFVKWQFNTHKDNICLQMRPSMKTTVWHALVALSFSPSYIYVHICI